MKDQLDDVLAAIASRRTVRGPAAWPTVDLISFRDFTKADAPRLRAFLRDVEQATGQALLVVGGGYGCSRLKLTVEARTPDEALRLLSGIMASEAFTEGALEAEFRIVLRDEPYTRIDLKTGAVEGAPVAATVPSPAGILFVAANAEDSDRLRLDDEIRRIDSALRSASLRDHFRLEQHWGVQAQDLAGCLMRHNPRVVHFSGHGTQSKELVLKGRDGDEQPVDAEFLARLFCSLRDSIRCVVFVACYSDKQARAIAACIDCVIGMSRQIGDETAVEFSAAFYEAIGYGKSVRTAFDVACARVGLTDPRDSKAARLYTRAGIDAGNVFVHA